MKNLKKILAAALALCLIFCVAGCGNNSGTSQKLIVATNAEFEPFESLDADGNFVGYEIDLMNAIGEKLGYEVQFENMEFDGVIAAVQSKSCDLAASGLTINEKRKKSVSFTTPVYGGAAQILIVANNDTHYTGTTKEALDEQLKNQAIGVCSGYTGQFYAKGDADWGFSPIEGADVKIYENVSTAIADIKNGTINAIIMDDSVAKEAANANSADVKVIDVALTVEEYGLAVNKDNTELLEKLNTALAELKAEGKIDELLQKYELN